eukprot:180542-Chlamydomonas_euryale.AAC.1
MPDAQLGAQGLFPACDVGRTSTSRGEQRQKGVHGHGHVPVHEMFVHSRIDTWMNFPMNFAMNLSRAMGMGRSCREIMSHVVRKSVGGSHARMRLQRHEHASACIHTHASACIRTHASACSRT